MAIVVNPISNRVVRDAENATVNLINNFDDPRTTGLIARFELFNTSVSNGITNVLLFDQPGAGAPLTVQNFRNYVNDGDYANSIIHRSVPGFIVQGGGFTVNGLSTVLTQTPTNGAAAVGVIPPNAPVQNEFSSDRSNLRGTIAMAKLGNDPNSATSQWFFNLGNNAANLDNQNGGFTVFGQVLGASDLAVIDAIASLTPFRADRLFGQPAFEELPLIVADPNNPRVSGDENLVRYRNITIAQANELQFSVVSNSNPNLLRATIANNQLVLDPSSTRSGTAAIAIRATNLLGEAVEDTFSVTVASRTPTRGTDILLGSNRNDVFDGLTGNDQISGLAGNDRLVGQAGGDRLLGGAGNDQLDGGAGNDYLEGGRGGDRIITGSGRDTIAISLREGSDRVIDFGDRRDKIQLTGQLSFQQLTIRQQADNTLIGVGRANLLILENVNASTLSQADFVS